MDEQEPAPEKNLFRLVIGRWQSFGWPKEPEIEWQEVIGLDLPEREPLEAMLQVLIKLPHVHAVRIDRLDSNRKAIKTVMEPFKC